MISPSVSPERSAQKVLGRHEQTLLRMTLDESLDLSGLGFLAQGGRAEAQTPAGCPCGPSVPCVCWTSPRTNPCA